MFSKPNRTTPTLDAPQPKRPMVASFVAEGARLRGDVTADGDLHLDGAVEGDINVGQLTIGERGAVIGAIRAETVEIRGQVTGTISARQVRLCATARVDGDISHAELSIEAGAHFSGRSVVTPTAAPMIEPLSVAAE